MNIILVILGAYLIVVAVHGIREYIVLNGMGFTNIRNKLVVSAIRGLLWPVFVYSSIKSWWRK